MIFINKEHLNTYLANITYLDQGSQGICYINKNKNIVIKIFHEYFEGEDCRYSFEEIMKLSGIKNTTFIWPTDVITLEGKIVGYVMPYIAYKSLCETDPLRINLKLFAKAILLAENDIKLLTSKNIRIFDIMYNILYRAGKFKVIDTIEYGEIPTEYETNRRGFDLEIMKFLVDNYFNYFVEKDKLLQDMYLSKDVSGYEFLTVFRDKLSEYMGFEVTKLSDAKSLVRRNPKSKYERNLY